MFSRFFVLVVILLFPLTLLAETRVITVENRPPDTLVYVVEQVLRDKGSVVADRNFLIVTAEPSKLNEVTTLIKKLDTPIQQYLVAVRRSNPLQQSNSEIQVDGSARIGDTTIRTSNNGKFTTKSTVTVRRSTGSFKSSGQQELRVMEGRRAFISLGESVPVVTHYSSDDYRRSHRDKSVDIDYRDATKGFYVVLLPSGDDIAVEVDTVADERQGTSGVVDIERTSTTIRTPPNQWVYLGGSQSDDRNKHQGLTQYSYDTRKEELEVWIKITPIK